MYFFKWKECINIEIRNVKMYLEKRPEPERLLFSFSVISDCLQAHGLQHTKVPCPSLSPRVCSNSCPTLETLRTVAHQAPLSMGFSRQDSWSGLPCPSPGDLPGPGITHASLTSPALAGGLFHLQPHLGSPVFSLLSV